MTGSSEKKGGEKQQQQQQQQKDCWCTKDNFMDIFTKTIQTLQDGDVRHSELQSSCPEWN